MGKPELTNAFSQSVFIVPVALKSVNKAIGSIIEKNIRLNIFCGKIYKENLKKSVKPDVVITLKLFFQLNFRKQEENTSSRKKSFEIFLIKQTFTVLMT
ncbi:CLUMA_CG010557, isoform A [Clunio marinus]|uniref:CLUMA_CG010557, isoform A n=1 Tax=Clunio marinus TaxID=568069 RepID=A0A1J1IA76_9DIPT|nr:CLUMA_CG010557, isoform A [Clunio marinus]